MISMVGLLAMIAMDRRALGTVPPPIGNSSAPVETAAIVQRARNGDAVALDELYRLHCDKAFHLLTRLVGAVQERDDLLQESFLQAFRALPTFRGDAAFATWLHRIVCNVAYRYLRKRPSRYFEELSTSLPSQAMSPVELAEQKRELQLAENYLAALHPKKRIAFVLRMVEGFSLGEIAELVGAEAAAVGQRVKHAQRELEAMLHRDAARQRKELS
jgi:RNA polymerase sigma-70 factor, ECF subfamily